jgi:hypothetical protein
MRACRSVRTTGRVSVVIPHTLLLRVGDVFFAMSQEKADPSSRSKANEKRDETFAG